MVNGGEVVRTSDEDWQEKGVRLVTKGIEFKLVDDADEGVTREDLEELASMLKAFKEETDLAWDKVLGLASGMTLTGTGIWMIKEGVNPPEGDDTWNYITWGSGGGLVLAAILSPEPTSTLGGLVVGGCTLGYAAFKNATSPGRPPALNKILVLSGTGLIVLGGHVNMETLQIDWKPDELSGILPRLIETLSGVEINERSSVTDFMSSLKDAF